jgi:hypothetical protein
LGERRFQTHEDLRERMLTHTKTLPAIRTLVETLKHRLDVRRRYTSFFTVYS